MSSHMVDSSTGIVVLDGQSLPVADVVRLADGTARPVPGTEAMKRVEVAWGVARELAACGRVYGRSTGVGANRNEDVPTGTAADHGLRLLRSHAGAIGEPLPAREVRAMLAVRANQLLAGGAGLRPGVITALCEALATGAHPLVNEFSLGHAVLSRGVEEQASFASLAARQTLRAGRAYRLVVGCELVPAVRALRQRGLRPDPELPVGRAFELAETVLDEELADRPLTDDVTGAAALLDRFTGLMTELTRGTV
ncbi:aromatic amino acid lyase [Streptomyces sp. CA-135486]|uniref:aromatic amino acid lyase n=1 Tax=Streptomyces sp. CA-135486 TaxID=3240049 RepID=UPI003D94E2E7